MPARPALSNCLRVIGQLLQQRGLALFDLEYSDSGFFLQCGSSTPPYLELVEFSCSPADIESLDTAARGARSRSFKLVEFENLPEVFRAIGRRIDDQDGKLLRLCNSDLPVFPESITIEYQSRDRRRHVEKIFLAAAGEHALRMHKARNQRFAN
jgi:hypothetical protein